MISTCLQSHGIKINAMLSQSLVRLPITTVTVPALLETAGEAGGSSWQGGLCVAPFMVSF